MEKSIFLTGIFWFGILLMSLFCAAWFIAEIGERNTRRNKEYDHLHRRIQNFIFDLKVNRRSYCLILLLLDRLRKLKYKNPEKTEILVNYFKIKYQPISDEILSEADACLKNEFKK